MATSALLETVNKAATEMTAEERAVFIAQLLSISQADAGSLLAIARMDTESRARVLAKAKKQEERERAEREATELVAAVSQVESDLAMLVSRYQSDALSRLGDCGLIIVRDSLTTVAFKRSAEFAASIIERVARKGRKSMGTRTRKSRTTVWKE